MLPKITYKSRPIIDNLVAARLVWMLCTPFKDNPLYKAGTIDQKGKYILPPNKRTKPSQRPTYLDRLVINLKKLINKLPGGELKLKNIVAAMILVKENYQNKSRLLALTESDLSNVVIEENDPYITEIKKLWMDYLEGKLDEEGEGAAPATGGGEGGEGGEGSVLRGGMPANNTKGIAIYDVPLGSQHLARRKQLRLNRDPRWH